MIETRVTTTRPVRYAAFAAEGVMFQRTDDNVGPGQEYAVYCRLASTEPATGVYAEVVNHWGWQSPAICCHLAGPDAYMRTFDYKCRSYKSGLRHALRWAEAAERLLSLRQDERRAVAEHAFYGI